MRSNYLGLFSDLVWMCFWIMLNPQFWTHLIFMDCCSSRRSIRKTSKLFVKGKSELLIFTSIKSPWLCGQSSTKFLKCIWEDSKISRLNSTKFYKNRQALKTWLKDFQILWLPFIGFMTISLTPRWSESELRTFGRHFSTFRKN